MPSSKKSSKPEKPSHSSSRSALPSPKKKARAAPATPAQRAPQQQPSGSSQRFRPIAPKPPAPSSSPPPPAADEPKESEESDKDEPVRQERRELIWPADRPLRRLRPRLLEQLPPIIAPTEPYTPSLRLAGLATPEPGGLVSSSGGPRLGAEAQSPVTIAPSLLSLTPEQREAESRAAAERAALAATPVRPPVKRRSGARLGRPPHQRGASLSGRSLRPLAPRPSPSSSPQQPSAAAASTLPSPAPSHPTPLEHPILSPTPRPAMAADAARSSTASPITQALPGLRLPPQHPFWGPDSTELVPCDETGTIRDAYRHERILEVEARRQRGARPPHWTVRHIQEVCTDVHRMPRAARSGFGDLHKQLRELYDLHAHVASLHPPPWARPDDVVPVTCGGVTTQLPRLLRDFICGMSQHLLTQWQPFARARPEWNVDSKITFLEDFSCFLRFHNKFFGQRVILMQAPGAPGWEHQDGLQFYKSVPFRGYQERLDTGLTSEERSRDSFVDCFWDN